MNELTIQGLPVAFQLDGPADGPPLVLLNSLGTNRGMWAGQMAVLSRTYRVVRYDVRGHGQSGVLTDPAMIDELGADLVGLLDQLEIGRAHLCGLSLGGVIAQWVAITHPERVGHLILANTAARIGSAEGWTARMEAVRAGGMAAVRDAVLLRFFSARFRATEPAIVAAFGAQLAATNPDGYIAACAALRDADLRPLVGTIRAPTLIIAGALDEATPPTQAEELRSSIPCSTLVVLPETGHLSNVEQPAAFTAALLQFLSDI